MKQSKLFVLAAICALAISACGAQEPAGDEPAEPGGGSTIHEPADQGAGPDSAAGEAPLTDATLLYYVSDSEMGELTELRLAAKDDGSGLHKRAIELLANDPGDGKVPLWKGVTFNRVELQDGVLTVDVTIPDAVRLGAPGEALALEAITRTAFQFEDVDALNILVDGEETDSLMGHETLEHPIHKS